MPRILINLALFQIGWFACVVGAAGGWPWGGVAVAASVAAWHIWRSPRPRPEIRLMLVAAAVGVAFDSLLVAGGLLTYASPVPLSGMAPVWIVAMWACFATTLNVGLRWLHGRTRLATMFGAAGGPAAYLGGEALGGVALSMPAIAALALGWGVIMPLLIAVAVRFDGWPATPVRQ
ncbi:MAG: DUF2878 domain-containing protein, partial [Proteobacteria bacterium]